MWRYGWLADMHVVDHVAGLRCGTKPRFVDYSFLLRLALTRSIEQRTPKQLDSQSTVAAHNLFSLRPTKPTNTLTLFRTPTETIIRSYNPRISHRKRSSAPLPWPPA